LNDMRQVPEQTSCMPCRYGLWGRISTTTRRLV